MTQDPVPSSPLPQLSSITFADGSIEVFGAVRPGCIESDLNTWMLRMEIRQPSTGIQILVDDNGFIYDFMRQAESFNPDLMAPTHGTVHSMTDCIDTANVDVAGMLFGLVSSNGHLLIALTDMNGNQRVAYLSPMCYAPDFFRDQLWHHPLTAFGVPTPYASGMLYNPDIVRSLARFCDAVHRPRTTGRNQEVVYRPPISITGALAMFLQQMLFNELKRSGEMRRRLHEIAESVYRSS